MPRPAPTVPKHSNHESGALRGRGRGVAYWIRLDRGLIAVRPKRLQT